MTGAPAVEDIVKSEYEHGFTTEIESDTLPPGLDEEVVRAISKRKGEPEFMTEQRLKAYRLGSRELNRISAELGQQLGGQLKRQPIRLGQHIAWRATSDLIPRL